MAAHTTTHHAPGESSLTLALLACLAARLGMATGRYRSSRRRGPPQPTARPSPPAARAKRSAGVLRMLRPPPPSPPGPPSSRATPVRPRSAGPPRVAARGSWVAAPLSAPLWPPPLWLRFIRRSIRSKSECFIRSKRPSSDLSLRWCTRKEYRPVEAASSSVEQDV
jgi:hypothetical protein